MQQRAEQFLRGARIRLLRLNPPIHRLQDAGDFVLFGERWEGDGKRNNNCFWKTLSSCCAFHLGCKILTNFCLQKI